MFVLDVEGVLVECGDEVEVFHAVLSIVDASLPLFEALVVVVRVLVVVLGGVGLFAMGLEVVLLLRLRDATLHLELKRQTSQLHTNREHDPNDRTNFKIE